MKFEIDGMKVYFPFPYLYPEQFQYMLNVKRTLDDGGGHALLEMATGTGKTVCLLSLILSYQLYSEDVGKLIYCTRTVQEMDKVIAELKVVRDYRDKCIQEDGQTAPPMLGLCLSSRRNMCIHSEVSQFNNRDKVDALCRNRTAPWVRNTNNTTQSMNDSNDNQNDSSDGDGMCSFYEQLERDTDCISELTGIMSLEDLQVIGRKRNWCPYYTSRRAINIADVVVFNFNYVLDPKVASQVSRELSSNSILVFDEAQNVDNICIEALSVSLNKRTLHAAAANARTLARMVRTATSDANERLREEYERLVHGLTSRGVLPANTSSSSNIASSLPQLAAPVPLDMNSSAITDALPGNIRKAKHFIMFITSLLQFFRSKLRCRAVIQESPKQFVAAFQNETMLSDGQTQALRFCSDRLHSLLRTLQVSDIDQFTPLLLCADLGTIVGTYTQGFTVLLEPFNDKAPDIVDPVLRLCCLDASIAIKPVLQRFRNVIITSGTLSPLDVYPKILNFTPKVIESFEMSMSSVRRGICPIIVSKGSDQLEMTSKFEKRKDSSVISNFGKLLVEFSSVVPDGIVCFFTSYSYMEDIISEWNRMGLLKEVLQHKLIFIETKDVVETSLALDAYKRACDCGRGAVFLSVARGKVAEGIDFDRHYGRAVLVFGVPYQYTLSRSLQARMDFLNTSFDMREGDFLSFDALRQAAQCVGRVIRSKTDYGLMVFADARYRRADKRSKLPRWIQDYLEVENMGLSTDRAVSVARDFLRRMGQPHSREDELGETLLNLKQVQELAQECGANNS